jgi:phosphatidylglycerol---prolipoprotein diacylglyceryl transferase
MSKFNLTPRKLAIYIAIFGLLLSIPLSIFFSQTFTRYWKVNQKIDLAEQVVISDIIAIPKISIGQTTIIPYTSIIPTSSIGIEPILIGTVSVRFYSLAILLGVLLGYAIILYLSKLNFVAGSIIDRLMIGLVVFGLIGARTFFVLFNWEVFKDKPLGIVSEIGQGGMAIFGSIIACSIYVYLYCKRYKFNFFEFADFLVIGLLVGQILGRFGNFFNYEGYGPETSVWWKMYVPETANLYGEIGSKYFHPTFLYEIIPNFCLLIFLLWKYTESTHKNSGLVFAKYAMGYGLIRFCTEYFRLDSLKIYFPSFLQFEIPKLFKFEFVMASQLSALVLFVIGVYIWKLRHRVIYLKKDMTELYI